jgi:hypothetical protein
MRWFNINPLLGLRITPTATDAAAWEGKCVHPVTIYDGEVQVTVDRKFLNEPDKMPHV